MHIPEQNVTLASREPAYCTAGREYFPITRDGRICRCYCRPHESCGHVTDPMSFNPWPSALCECRVCPTDDELIWTTITDRHRQTTVRGTLSRWRGKDAVEGEAERMVFPLFYVQRCNLRCWYCSSGSHMVSAAVDKRLDIPADTWLSFFSRTQQRFRMPIVVCVMGGEPLLRDDLPRLVYGLCGFGIDCRLYTNLSLGDRLNEVLEAAGENPRSLRIVTTIHPHDPHVKWKDIVRRIKQIRQRGHAVDVTAVDVMPKGLLEEVDETLRAQTGCSLTVIEDMGGRGWKAPADSHQRNSLTWAQHHIQQPAGSRLQIEHMLETRGRWPFMVGLQQIGCQERLPGVKTGMVMSLLQRGVRWFDSAQLYGEADRMLGEALAQWSEPVGFVTKIAAQTPDELRSKRDAQRQALCGARPSALLLHSVDFDHHAQAAYASGGLLDVLSGWKGEGDIGAVGVSTSNARLVDGFLNDPRVDLLYLPVNMYIDCFHNLPGWLETANRQKKVVVGMQGLASGRLGGWLKSALGWIMQYPTVMPLIGVNRIEQADEIAEIMRGRPQAEQADVDAARLALAGSYCLWCRQCNTQCPKGIDIACIMQLPNFEHVLRGQHHTPFKSQAAGQAARCDHCGRCSCAYGIDLPKAMHEAVAKYRP